MIQFTGLQFQCNAQNVTLQRKWERGKKITFESIGFKFVCKNVQRVLQPDNVDERSE